MLVRRPIMSSECPVKICENENYLKLSISNFQNPVHLNAIASTMERDEVVESPRKRQKVADSQTEDNGQVAAIPSTPPSRVAREPDVGITEFVSADISGFEGILKKRFVPFYLGYQSVWVSILINILNAGIRTF